MIKSANGAATPVWVTEGKTQHSALLLEEKDTQKHIQWSSTGKTEWVDASRVCAELAGRRRDRTNFYMNNAQHHHHHHHKTIKKPRRVAATVKEEPGVAVKGEELDVTVEPSTKETEDQNKENNDWSNIVAVEEEEGAKENDNTQKKVGAVPDVPISGEAVKQEVISTSNEDIKIKKEGSASSLSAQERLRRKACFEQWKKANTDPRTNQGRYVFRRGCHVSCITKVLGGSGMEPWPLVKRPPRLFDTGEDNPFIAPKEFYVAGDEAFNPFGPRFPGDQGLVHIGALNTNPDQKEFHLFVQCADKPHKRIWHGRGAAGGRMYVGVYKRVNEEDEIISSVRFRQDLISDNQKSIAEYYVKRHYSTCGNKLNPEVSANYANQGMRLFDGTRQEWNLLNSRAKDAWIMRAYLSDTDYTMEVAPVEFVRYDEKLYQCLVMGDCAAE